MLSRCTDGGHQRFNPRFFVHGGEALRVATRPCPHSYFFQDSVEEITDHALVPGEPESVQLGAYILSYTKNRLL